MKLPRIQFSARRLMLAVTGPAIYLGGIAWLLRVSGAELTTQLIDEFIWVIEVSAFVWLPLLVFAYALGRRTITAGMIATMALLEALGLLGWWWSR